MSGLNLLCDCYSICPDIKKLKELESSNEKTALYEDLVDQFYEVCSTIGTSIPQYCLIKKELRGIQ